MVYKKDLVRHKGKHIHTKGMSLAAEADMVQYNILKSSGFFKPGSGINHGFGTQNPSMDNFISKWNNMNVTQRKGPLPYAKGPTRHQFRGL